MYSKELNERNPLRLFEHSIHGGLGRGNIGVVVARHGIGKTAFLVGSPSTTLMRGRKVLHVSLGQDGRSCARVLRRDLHGPRPFRHLEDLATARLEMERHRMIHTYAGGIVYDRQAAPFDPTS